MRIVNINPAFRKMFQCGNAVLGRQVSYLMDASGFETLSDGGSERFEAVISHYGKTVSRGALHLARCPAVRRHLYGHLRYSASAKDHRHCADADLRQAQENCWNHQIRMSQEIAGMLGKSTAKGEGWFTSS
jgi:hypothetical protein